MRQRPVKFGPTPGCADSEPETAWWPAGPSILEAAGECQGNPATVLRALARATVDPPVPGQGSTVQLWEFLASLGAIDLVAARSVEPHFDAAAILGEAGKPWQPSQTWGVYAAEGPGSTLEATADDHGQWELNGVKPWCSLAGQISHALISAHTAQGRRLFTVQLDQPGIQVETGNWISRGMARLPSGSVRFASVKTKPVGPAGWYLERAGFAVGGAGVAACWFGGAIGIFRHLLESSAKREPDQLASAWLGEADRLLAGGAQVLHHAAGLADRGALDAMHAARVRGHIAQLCGRVLQISAEATGPGPLATDENHARRVADLGIYVRQHHGARDDAALGRMVYQQHAQAGARPW
ncbi:acyl-CoA dehydrogenase family protein [Glutamicibacter sp. BW77]|uniref:acyl-CoA dehydrogenase family protein n=1 Tax=Glutamicibacter sp. BW77 TaxID=2024402 RepID=UPI0011421233|nr:acyl-CoA dehydrogenase family protein [Glutamicibacter sp. BW77]